MKRALPTNSIRFISGDTEGMKRLSTTPTKNAPRIGSSPAGLARAEARKTRASTKMYCDTLSLYFLKNHRAMRGKTKRINKLYATMERMRRTQNHSLIVPVCIPTMTASMMSAPNTVMIVPAMVMVTAGRLPTPYRSTIG